MIDKLSTEEQFFTTLDVEVLANAIDTTVEELCIIRVTDWLAGELEDFLLMFCTYQAAMGWVQDLGFRATEIDWAVIFCISESCNLPEEDEDETD